MNCFEGLCVAGLGNAKRRSASRREAAVCEDLCVYGASPVADIPSDNVEDTVHPSFFRSIGTDTDLLAAFGEQLPNDGLGHELRVDSYEELEGPLVESWTMTHDASFGERIDGAARMHLVILEACRAIFREEWHRRTLRVASEHEHCRRNAILERLA